MSLDIAGLAAWLPLTRHDVGHGDPLMPVEVRREAYAELASAAAAGRITVEMQRYSLEESAQAWAQQADGTHSKIVVIP